VGRLSREVRRRHAGSLGVRPGSGRLARATRLQRAAVDDADDGAEGWHIADVVPNAGADREKLLTAYVSPARNVTILGLHTDGGAIATTSHDPVPYSIGGLPPNSSFRLLSWNGDGDGGNTDWGFVESDAAGVVQLSVPLDAVFALTNTPIISLPW
jgi:hypothetical protein